MLLVSEPQGSSAHAFMHLYTILVNRSKTLHKRLSLLFLLLSNELCVCLRDRVKNEAERWTIGGKVINKSLKNCFSCAELCRAELLFSLPVQLHPDKKRVNNGNTQRHQSQVYRQRVEKKHSKASSYLLKALWMQPCLTGWMCNVLTISFVLLALLHDKGFSDGWIFKHAIRISTRLCLIKGLTQFTGHASLYIIEWRVKNIVWKSHYRSPRAAGTAAHG